MGAGAWRRLPLVRQPVGDLLARAVALLDDVEREGAPVLAWSQASAPGLVLGRAARDPELDSRALERAGIAVHRRSSGGGAVLWDSGLLALDVALPPSHDLVARDVVETYAFLGRAFGQALVGLGIDGVNVVTVEEARRLPTPQGLRTLACFGSLSPYEVTVEGAKTLGLSQVRRRHGTLLQAGLLLDHDADTFARLFGEEEDAAGELERSVATVGDRVGASEVIAAVEEVLGGSPGS